jgi:two-component system CheB/CheR fusion protein
LRLDLRRSIIFGRHDLVQDAPISRIDLLICRNTLMYFDAETQARILTRFHYALNDSGYLFLGKAEMLLTRDARFTPVDMKQRVFRKVPRGGMRERLLVMPAAESVQPGSNRQARLREVVADALPVGLIVVDAAGCVISVNARARSLFGLVPADIGRPLNDLDVSYRPVELRSLIQQAYRERRAVERHDVTRDTGGNESQHFDVQVVPLVDHDRTMLGVSISFRDVTEYKRLYRELERSKSELDTATEELHSTNEELETTNEELQSTVEELETTNEELQSSNEELETMNEELESTNTELEAINTELEQRSVELDELSSFLGQILANLQMGVAVLDSNLRIQLWNRRAEDLWGVRADETVGHHLLGLDIGLPLGELAQPIKNCLTSKNGRTSLTVKATNRRGREFSCRVQCAAMPGRNGGRGLILLMEPEEVPAGSASS